ncbi:MAG: DUF1203 domain-containing protein [Gemmatimonadaceae bacterium]|nr:DUF1203 domain-containing protein [Gemmatimonadaceae bacterium]
MAEFIVRPISRDITTEVRSTRLSPRYGHPVYQETARGTGPCRECLRAFVVGRDERVLFTYTPFNGELGIPQPGPVFIHAEACVGHFGLGYPDGLRGIPMAVQPYYAGGVIGSPIRLPPDKEELLLAALIGDPLVQFAHLRHAEAGCFVARVERAAG